MNKLQMISEKPTLVPVSPVPADYHTAYPIAIIQRPAESDLGLDENVQNQVRQEFPWLWQHQNRLFRLALREAEALAWQTGLPRLMLPELAHEKMVHLAAWQERQNRLKESSQHWAALAA